VNVMRRILSCAVYPGALVLANAGAAQDIGGLLTGEMRAFDIVDPMPTPGATFLAEDGTEMRLADFAGQVTLVNFWATWCAPCRVEMPHLSQLQDRLGGEDFSVVTIATGRNPLPAIEAFLDEIGVDNLPMHTDPRQGLSRQMGVLGLPVSVILDRDAQEIGRLTGGADWTSPEAIALIETLIAR